MDPISALTVASAVAQFLEFGYSIFSTARKIHKSVDGSLDELNSLGDAAARLQSLRDKVANLTTADNPFVKPDASGHVTTGSFKVSDTKARELSLTNSCSALAGKLSNILAELKVDGQPSRMKSVRLAIKMQGKKADLEACDKAMNSLRSELVAHLLATVYDRHSEVAQKLDSLHRDNMLLDAKLCTRLDEFRADLQSKLKDESRLQGVTRYLSDTLPTFTQEARKADAGLNILQSLHFEAMQARIAAVAQRHERTYDWIFQSADELEETLGLRVGFLEWLQTGDGIYWISGKAGSGKSTLMKFLCNHPSTNIALEQWAAGSKLITAEHFFWSGGSDLQKSQLGLLRTLCFEILRKCPALMRKVCAEQWQDRGAGLPSSLSQSWTVEYLAVVFHRLGSQDLQIDGENIRFCFFIDGLDEYSGNDPRDLVKALRSLCRSTSIKICASSRPWNVFINAFGSDKERMLTLQDLTYDDIAIYVTDELRQNDEFAQMEQFDPRCGEIVAEVTEKADGVFFWVFLVVRELLKSLDNGDSLYDLRRRVDSIPPGLEPYFRRMFDTIDQFYREQTAETFLTCIHARSTLALIGFSVLERQDELAVRAEKGEPMSLQDVAYLHAQLKKRVIARCGDLIDVFNWTRRGTTFTFTVDFLHRTVRDFLRMGDIVEMLETRVSPGFQPFFTLCRMKLLTARRMGYLQTGDYTSTFRTAIQDLLFYAKQLEQTQEITPAAILDQLEAAGNEAAVNRAHVFFPGAKDEDSMPLLIEEDMYMYLEHRACQDEPGFRKVVTMQRNRPLLGVALKRRSNPKVVSLLLQHGADANQPMSSTFTIWSDFLYNIHRARLSHSDVVAKELLLICEAMIKGGAEYIEKCVLYGTSRKISEHELLSMVFGAVEADRLMRCRSDFPELDSIGPQLLLENAPRTPLVLDTMSDSKDVQAILE